MKNSDGRSASRLARVLGLIIVLGLPLAVASPLDSGLKTGSRGPNADEIAAGAATAVAPAGNSAVVDGYTPAAPASPESSAPVEVRP